MKKKIVIWSMVSVMMISALGGCGSSNQSATAPAGQETAQNETTDEEKSQEEMKNISMMTIDFNGSPLSAQGSDEVISKMEEYTNTHVDFTWVPSDSYEDKLGVTLMDQNSMPMILTATGTSISSTMLQAAKAGAFWDLTEYLKDSEEYPNLSQANENVLKALTVDGKIIGIYRSRPIGRNALGYRKDWADKLGLSEPKTVEDVYNMAYEFTFGDPDGNGKDDTYGISLSKGTGAFDIVQAWFGGGNGWVEEDGKLIPAFQKQEYLDTLNWFKKMYDEGLIVQDFAVRDATTAPDVIKNGQCGMYITAIDDSRRIWDYFIQNNIPSVNGDETASMNLVGAIARDDNSEAYTQATDGMNGYFVITKAAKTEEDVKACLHYLDKMCDDEMMALADYGIEGISFEFDEEGKVFMKGLELNQLPNNGLNQVLCYIPDAVASNPPRKWSDTEQLQEKVKEENIEKAVYNPAKGYLANSETYALNGGNMDQILTDARVQYICGQIDEAGLRTAWKLWGDQGGTQVIEEVNALYMEDSSK